MYACISQESILESAYDDVRPTIGNYSEEHSYMTVNVKPMRLEPSSAHPKVSHLNYLLYINC